MNEMETEKLVQLDRYSIGDFVASKNGFYHQCHRTSCRETFFGRKNRKYCSSACKNRVNNDLQANRYDTITQELKDFKNNAMILEKHFNDQIIPTKVSREHLLQSGFVSGGISKVFRIEKYDGYLYGYGDFAIQPTQDDHILIIKKPW